MKQSTTPKFPLRNYKTGENPRCHDLVLHVASGRKATVSGTTAQGRLLVRREGAKRREWFWTDELQFIERGGMWKAVA